MTELTHKFCVAYARGEVDPELITKSDEEIKPVLDELRPYEGKKATDEGRSMFSLNKQVDKVVKVLSNGFRKLAPAIKKAAPVSPAPGLGNPIGGALRPI